MPPKPVLSVLLAFRNRRNEAVSSLKALFEVEKIPFELIVIDDASTDGTPKAIQHFLDTVDHSDTTFIKHDKPNGRGRCLDEALQKSTAPIIWMPSAIRSIDEKSLKESVANIRSGSAPCLIHTSKLPMSLSDWPEFIQEGEYPEDENMLWNMNNMLPSDRFINPYMAQYHGLEWLIRLEMDAMESRGKFYRPKPANKQQTPSSADRKELLFALMRRPGITTKERKKIAGQLTDIQTDQSEEDASKDDYQLLEKAVKLKMRGQLSESLDLVEKVLKHRPGNSEAKHLKITLLESNRRYVEASELKREMQNATESGHVHPKLTPAEVKTSLIIPTTLRGRPALENCLVSINEYCTADRTELIIVDNASLDDTYDYIQELQEKNFFNCRSITNQQNSGFATSVNQALEMANGKYACIMHNDVELEDAAITQMEKLMDENHKCAVIAPLTDATSNPEQAISGKGNDDEKLVETDHLDSFVMMTRTSCELRMDETYKLAFMDDIDFCYEARDQGYKIGIAANTRVIHHSGTTTYAMGLNTNTRQYWKNISYFNGKWDARPFSEVELHDKTELEQLLLLDEWVNPFYPESAIQTRFDELFTEELRTEILSSDYEQEVTRQLIHLMMVMGKRDIMRRLEERISDTELPTKFLYELIRYYFNHNVYSRCLHYLNKLTDDQESIKSELYRLAILVDEKKMAEAIPLLTALLNKAPSNPRLYKLAGDVHSFEGNSKEAESFYELAEQINPFDYGKARKRQKV